MERTAPKRRPGGPRPRPNHDLIAARIRAGLSRDDLASLAGTTYKTIRALEVGTVRNPHIDTVTGISKVLTADPVAIFPRSVRP